MSAADPHTDDLADRLEQDAEALHDLDDMACDGKEARLRAAAAELRRLRHRDAALTRLLDAVGEGACKGALDCWTPITHDAYGDGTPVERECGDCPPCRIAAAVEDIDREHKR